MSLDAPRLSRECEAFARFLVGTTPEPYVVRKYAEAHERLVTLGTESRFDRLLLQLARRGGVAVKIADAYAVLFAPQSTLRKKLVTLLAILETCPPTFRVIDTVDPGPRSILLLRMCTRAAGAVAATIIGTVMLLPLHLILRGGGKTATP